MKKYIIYPEYTKLNASMLQYILYENVQPINQSNQPDKPNQFNQSQNDQVDKKKIEINKPKQINEKKATNVILKSSAEQVKKKEQPKQQNNSAETTKENTEKKSLDIQAAKKKEKEENKIKNKLKTETLIDVEFKEKLKRIKYFLEYTGLDKTEIGKNIYLGNDKKGIEFLYENFFKDVPLRISKKNKTMTGNDIKEVEGSFVKIISGPKELLNKSHIFKSFIVFFNKLELTDSGKRSTFILFMNVWYKNKKNARDNNSVFQGNKLGFKDIFQTPIENKFKPYANKLMSAIPYINKNRPEIKKVFEFFRLM